MGEVHLKNVCKEYAGAVTAVSDFSLDIRDGEFLVLVGPSGCGKSTTLRMVAGLEEITSGTISIGDRAVNDVAPKDRDIAMVFQNYALYPHMSVRENMAFGLKLRKFKKKEIERRVNEAAKILGLEEYMERRPKALSGGQRQRVAMGRAIVREPSVFLFDEPLSNLDAKMRVEMRKEILHLHKRVGRTVMYVTHDQVEAMTLGDRICVMREGIIEQVGEPLEVFRHPASLFVARFIGTPPMNIFEGILRSKGQDIYFDGQTVQAPIVPRQHDRVKDYVDKPVCLGLRPGALSSHGTGGDQSLSFEGTVEVSEPLGSETLVHLVTGQHHYTMSISGLNDIALDETIRVSPNMELAHVFDAETGTNLTLREL